MLSQTDDLDHSDRYRMLVCRRLYTSNKVCAIYLYAGVGMFACRTCYSQLGMVKQSSRLTFLSHYGEQPLSDDLVTRAAIRYLTISVLAEP